MKIEIEPANWGEAQLADIFAVVKSASDQIVRHCGIISIPIVKLKTTADNPITWHQHDPDGSVVVGITARDRHWAQYAYQFAHEFVHILSDHSGDAKRIWQQKHSNFWFVESLCEMGSLFVLRSMSRKWKFNPPYSNWSEYAPALFGYAEDIITKPEHQLAPDVSFLAWFANNECKLRLNCELREKNALIACNLLKFFEREPSLWKAVPYLNCGTRNLALSFSSYLCEWITMSPPTIKDNLVEIASLFGIAV